MKTIDAVKTLGLSTSFDMTDVKKQYRKLASKYHPDKNPNGLTMMQIINEAYETLGKEDWHDLGEVSEDESHYAETVDELLMQVAAMDDVLVEVCGSWIWCTGNTKPYKEVFKTLGMTWAHKKLAWYLKPAGEVKKGWRGKAYSLDEIRERHGSSVIRGKAHVRVS